MHHGSSPRSNRGANGGTSRLPAGTAWRSHSGRRQQLRHYRQSWARIEKLCAKDRLASAARERLLDAVAEEPGAEFAAMQLGHTALLAAADCRVSWADSMNHLLNQLEKNAEAAEASPDLGVGPDGMPPDLKAALAVGA
jgi:hypothetical protein